MNEFLATILLFLPAGIANMSPVIVNKVPFINKWNTPMDFGLSFRGVRILGNNKRWRGIVAGTIFAIVTALIIDRLILKIDQPVLIGLLLGLGALLGDAFESFIKRQKKVLPGESWFPWDQLDYIIGGLLLSWPVARYTFTEVVYILLMYFVLHLAIVYVAYKFGIRSKPI